MIANLKNLKGVKSLTKPEQKNVKGGQICRFTLSGGTLEAPIIVDLEGYAEGRTGSIQANAACVSYLSLSDSAGDRCQYDCAYDGFGA